MAKVGVIGAGSWGIALATALAQIEKQFGKGAIMKLGDNTAMQVDAISTGSLGLDLALGADFVCLCIDYQS